MSTEDSSLEPIAIVGMSGRFPGASDVGAFWRNLISGRETVSHFDAGELEFSVPDRGGMEKTVRSRGVLEGVDLFDAEFFGIHPREAELMDPQHRVFLECAWEAIEGAGYDPAEYPGLIGVYAGASLNTYLLYHLEGGSGFAARLAGNYQVGEYLAMLGNDKDFLPTRLAYKMGLRGPCVAIQCACSTSLVAVWHACTSLQTYQCDMALAGGVSITFPQRRDYLYQEDGMVSPDGRCRSFDAAAQGTVFGHGCAALLLKRLTDAVADGDNVLAVIRGGAVNNDGSDKVGYAAPSVNAQAEVIALAQAAAGVDPGSISYIEAHGTGTPLGDPIEVAALTRAFRDAGATGSGFCAIGTGKTHIGHLDVASGATGLIKTVLQLQHGVIPPLLHFSSPNPRIDFASSPFYPATREIPWARGEMPRRAGVSAFGVGGTNAHLIVEEAPQPPPASSSRAGQLLLLSARTPEALALVATNLADHIGAHPDLDLADVAFTLARGRRHFALRHTVAASDAAGAIAALRKPATPTKSREDVPGAAFIFPGQGAQAVDMGRGLYGAGGVFREEIDRVATLLKEPLGVDLRDILYPDESGRAEAERLIHRTSIAQPAIFAVSLALARQWISWGVRPVALIGHSVGEFVAAVLAGAFTAEEAIGLLAERARLMGDMPGGSMLAVRLPASELEGSLPAGIEIAAINSPKLCTLSGPTDAIAAFSRELEGRKIPSRLLPTSHAYHSAAMDPIADALAGRARSIVAREPSIPWISTCTGEYLSAADLADGRYWSRQLRGTVRFHDSVTRALADGHTLFLECGPGEGLSQFVRQSAAGPGVTAISSLPATGGADLLPVQAALGKLWASGIRPDWSAYFAGETRRRVPLPTYPFQRKSYWVDRSRTASLGGSVEAEPPIPDTISDVDPTPVAGPADRPAQFVSAVTGMVRELSGLVEVDPGATFAELGFDSLFLAQLSRSLGARFGVKITFRQLLGDLPSAAAVAAHLDASLPDGAAPEPAATAAPARVAAGSRLPAILKPTRGVELAPVAGKRFGPFRPVERGEGGALTDRQRAALADLVARYTAHTGASKRYTAEHRPHYADPRAVSGFQSQWKEMVYPIVSSRSKGSRIWDLDGNEYVDITMGFGTYFFGHSPDWLVAALQKQLDTGIEIGPQSGLAGSIARDLGEFTGMERSTFCNTGSEAVMAAIRLARAVTGRDRVVYFTGDYHGMFDEVLVRGAWVDGEYRAQPIAPGIPPSLVENMLVLDYASPESLEILRAHAHELAAVLVEPVQSRQPGLQPRDFLREVRELTERSGTALIFDEVVTGFRCHPGGAQAYFGVRADMATYGKVVGGGVPIGILAGSARFMDALDGGEWSYGDDSVPEVGMTFFAGTFVRHPLAMAAARAVLDHLRAESPGIQLRMTERTSLLCRTLNERMESAGVPIRLPYFSAFAVIDHPHELRFASLLWYHLRLRGVHVWEGRPIYLTTAHTDEDFEFIVRAFDESVAEMQEGGFLPAGGPAVIPARLPLVDSSPMTEAQREIWSSAQMGDDANRAYNESNAIEFDGSLDREALGRALLHIVQRHPALRSTFSEDGERQIYAAAPGRIEMPVHDLTALPAAERDARYDAIRSETTLHVFDLVRGPLLRTALVVLGPARHSLVFAAHHMVCDGWSFGMVVDELARSYNGFRSGGVPMLLPPLAFGDYARDLRRARDAGGDSADRDYWVSIFAGGAPVLDLPTDRVRPALKSYAGAMETIEFDRGLFARLKEASPRLGGTFFVHLLSAFAALIHRLSGQDSIVVGVPSAGQTLAGADELVGHCLNFLPLRIECAGDRTFGDFAESVGRVVLDAYEHQGYTFGSLVRELRLPRDTSRLPLVSVMFNIDHAGFDRVHFDDLDFRVLTNAKHFVNFDLFFNLVQGDDLLAVECEYNTDLFDPGTIRRWLAAFETLVGGVVASDGATALDELPLLADGERLKLLEGWNATARDYPRDSGVHELVAGVAREFPDRPAVRCGPSILSYAELDRRSDALAAHLAGLGVVPGDLVGLLAERSAEMVVGLLGILKTGAGYVPMDPAFPAERLGFMVEDARIRVIVTKGAVADAIPGCDARLVDLDEPIPEAAGFIPHRGGGESVAYAIFTSGSTGRPKGVLVPHRALANFLQSMRREPGLAATDTLLSVTTLSFDISGLEIFLPLTTGACVAIATREMLADGDLLLREIGRVGANVLQATPATFRLLLEAGWRGGGEMKLLIGGEAVPLDLVERLIPLCGSLWNMYGPTEATIWSTTCRLGAGAESVPIGRPIDNTRVYVVGPSLGIQPVGIPGELLIGGEGVAIGYLGRPELTAGKFIADPFTGDPCSRLYRTGDLVRWRPDGQLEFISRLDGQIKLRGYRIEPGEIEAELVRHADVGQAAVVLREDVPGEPRLVAYVVVRAGSIAENLAARLREHLASRLPAYMVPAFFVFPGILPLTPNGKVDRRALPAPEGGAPVVAGFVEPSGAIEEKLAAIWRDVLRLDRVSADADIFDLGGDSILIFRLAARANREGVAISPAHVFQHRTIALLAQKIEGGEQRRGLPQSPIRRLNRESYKRRS